MKILHLNYSDSVGGASRAAFRIHETMKRMGLESSMLVQNKTIQSNEVLGLNNFDSFRHKLWRKFDSFLNLIFKKNQHVPFNIGIGSNGALQAIKRLNPDVVILHWINNGLISIEEIRQIEQPLIWIMHDSWPFTGGCHLPGSCEKYKLKCGNCPSIKPSFSADPSRIVWQRKKKSWQNKKIFVCSPSKWLESCAKNSSLFLNSETFCIANPIDCEKFKPLDRCEAIFELGLDKNKKHILFGGLNTSSDPNKGQDLLKSALQQISHHKDIELLTFGENDANQFKDLLFKVKSFGKISDDKMLEKIYSSADLTVVPSRCENFPNLVLESFACGTPVIAFSVGGIPELIDHKLNGFLATPFDCKDFADGILWVLSNKNYLPLRQLARAKAIKSDFPVIGEKYLELLNLLLRK